MKFANKVFGNRLRQFLDEANLKQKDLAQAVDVETPTISRWVTGEFMPDDDKFRAICQFLKKEPDEFFGIIKFANLSLVSQIEAVLESAREAQSEIDPRETRLLNLFRGGTFEQKKAILEWAQMTISDGQKSASKKSPRKAIL